MKKLAALAFAAAVSLHAIAAEKNGVVVTGAGAQPCSAWQSGRAAGPADPQRIYEAMILTWVQGHMTGMNTAQYNLGLEMQPMPDTETLRAALDDYCADHPNDTIWKATLVIHTLWTAQNFGFAE